MKIFINLFCQLLILAAPVYADGQWVVKKEADGIQVQQQNGDKAITKGVMTVGATPDALIAVLRDAPACPRWVFGCKEGKQAEIINPAERINYTVLSSPFPLEDRDIYMHALTRYQRKTSTITVTLTGREKYAPEQQGRTRVLDLRGSWVFQPLEPGKVQVTYQIYTNPQVTLGTSVVNDHMVKSVFGTLQGLRKLVKEPKYHDKQFTEAEIRAIEVK